MKVSDRNKIITIIVQVLIWLLFGVLLLLYLPSTWGIELPAEFWVKQGAVFLLLVGTYYFNSLFLVPRLLLENRIYSFILIVLILAVLITWIIQSTEEVLHLHELMDKALKRGGAKRQGPGAPAIDMFMLLMSLLVLGISTSVTAIQKWQHDARVRQMLEQQKITSELSYLKAQINPHFFFNTLNNIYALTYIEVDSSRQALHKLSRMMRYLLYETQGSTVLLSKEVSFIVDYIELMKLRITDNVTVDFEPPELNDNPEIAPMLFLPFIENAFKHGISSLQAGYIKVNLKLEGRMLEMKIINTLYEKKRSILDDSSGIGMNNTRRRLDLLYHKKYTLDVSEDLIKKEYRIYLTLDLS